MSEIFGFINALEKSKYFQNVKTRYVTKSKAEDKVTTDFEIVCPLAVELQQNLMKQA